MKKTLVAAAVSGLLASTTFAQNVTLAGLVDVFVGSIQYSGDKRTGKADSNGMTIVKVGTLDDPTHFAPVVSVWTSTKMPWVELPEGQRGFERNAG